MPLTLQMKISLPIMQSDSACGSGWIMFCLTPEGTFQSLKWCHEGYLGLNLGKFYWKAWITDQEIRSLYREERTQKICYGLQHGNFRLQHFWSLTQMRDLKSVHLHRFWLFFFNSVSLSPPTVRQCNTKLLEYTLKSLRILEIACKNQFTWS